MNYQCDRKSKMADNRSYNRVVIKIGTSTLTEGGPGLCLPRIDGFGSPDHL